MTEKEVKEESPKEIKESKKDAKFELVEVPTQYGIAIQTPNKELLDTNQAMVALLNEVTEIKKALA